MIQEAHVSFEVAKLLKEKGFSGTSRKYYRYPYDSLDECDNRFAHNNDYCNTAVEFEKGMDESDFSFYDVYNDIENLGKEIYVAPTQALAMAWLREEKNLYIEIRRNLNTFYFKWYIQEGAEDRAFSEYKYKSYEEAVEAALLHVLQNLI